MPDQEESRSCCCRRKQRNIKLCGLTLCIFSVVLFVFSIFIAITGLIASNAKIFDEVKIYLDSSDGMEGLPMPVNFFIVSLGFLFALFAWFVALCGCCSSIKKNRNLLIVQGICSLAIMFLFWIFGAVFIVQGTYGNEYVQDRCDKIASETKLTGVDSDMFTKATSIDASLIKATSYMCSETCPCYYNKEGFEQYSKIPEEELNKYNRTGVGMCVKSQM